MSFKFLYDVPYVKQVIIYFLIPMLIFIILCSVILLFYSRKGVNNIIYKYRANVFSIIISILLTVVFFSILLGFSYAFKKQIDTVGLKTNLSYLVIASPVIPFFVLVHLFFKLIRVTRHKPPKNIEPLEIDNDSVKLPDEITKEEVLEELDTNDIDKLETDDIEVL